MKDSVFNELSQINQINDNINEKYKRLRKLYCENQDVEVVAVSYAKLLSRLNEPSYLQRALKICDRLSNQNTKMSAEVELIRYRALKKLNPNKSVRTLNSELDSIDLTKDNVKREVLFEKLLLVSDDTNSKLPFDKLKQSYIFLLKSCPNEEHFLKNGIYNKLVSLLIKNEDYNEILNITKYLRDSNYNVVNMDKCEYYAKYKLGILDNASKESKLGYYEIQINNYNEMLAISHIQKHLSNDLVECKSVFNKNIDINGLFYEVKSYIEKVEPTESTSVIDIYVIPTERPIGTADNQISSTIKVITEINTKNIHTMYPIALCYDSLVQRQTDSFVKVKKRKQ